MKITEAFDLYRKQYIEVKHQSPRTQETHEYVKRSISIFLDNKNIEDVTLDDISLWVNKISTHRSSNTVRNYIIKVRLVLKYCEICGISCVKYERIAVPKRIDPMPSWLTPKEVTMMIDAAYNIRDKFIISLLYDSGIRVSEMINLNRGQIRNREFVVRGKGDKVRPCFIGTRTKKYMDKYLNGRSDSNPALIITDLGCRISKTAVEFQIRAIAKRAGFGIRKITPHTFRHSFATDFIDNGGSVRDLSRLLGHSNLAVTSVYTHIKDTELKKAHLTYHSI